MKRAHCIISGDVVGVGYRSWAKHMATSLSLSGWVKNREDKSVELVAEGKKDAIGTLIAACRKGPDVAWVKRVDVAWQNARGEFAGFEVLY